MPETWGIEKLEIQGMHPVTISLFTLFFLFLKIQDPSIVEDSPRPQSVA